MSKNAGRIPHGRGSLCPKSERVGPDACSQGPPGAGRRHAGKYREWTLSRQRGGGGGNATPLPTGSGYANANRLPRHQIAVFVGKLIAAVFRLRNNPLHEPDRFTIID